MKKQGSGIVFYVLAIAVLALAGLIVLILQTEPGKIKEETAICQGDCAQFCEHDEQEHLGTDCPYMKPICCVKMFP